MTYAALSDFMRAWFHQDFDIEGNTVAEMVGAFRRVSSPHEQRELKSGIERFLAEHPSDLDIAFEEAFQPDVSAAAFSGCTRAFLEEIRDLLEPRAECS
jgi:hypothetical protein